MKVPDLRTYAVHKVIDDIDLDGVVVPGLRATFHRRPAGERIETVGVYSYGGTEVFMAWGYVGEKHCRYTAYREPSGWSTPYRGCPELATVQDLMDKGPGRLAAAGLGAIRVPVS